MVLNKITTAARIQYNLALIKVYSDEIKRLNDKVKEEKDLVLIIAINSELNNLNKVLAETVDLI